MENPLLKEINPGSNTRVGVHQAAEWQTLVSLGRTLSSIKHLLPSFHPRHGLYVLPPVTVLDGPLLQIDTKGPGIIVVAPHL